MRTRIFARKLNRTVEHEGSKSPIKEYTREEIEAIEVEDPIEFSTVRQARRSHTKLHWAWEDRDLEGWSYEEIVAEHARVVQYIVNRGGRHVLVDSLDTTLPEGLKERSINPNYDLSFLTGIKNETIELFLREGIDSVTKLKRAEAEELAEQTDIRLDYIERLQERAAAL